MLKLKQLLESNTTFRKIFHEESTRINKILKEYNESEIWRDMPESLRKIALQTAGSVVSSNLDDYSEEDNWLNLPDVITNRINISDFDIPKNISADKLAEFIEQNKDKLPNKPWYQGSVGNPKNTYEVIEYLNSGRTNTWTLKNIIGYMKLHGNFPDFDFTELVPVNNQSVQTTPNADINPREVPSGAPSKNRDWRGGNYTGD
jgi:hypothetical protein